MTYSASLPVMPPAVLQVAFADESFAFRLLNFHDCGIVPCHRHHNVTLSEEKFSQCTILPLLVEPITYDDRKMCACSTKSPIFSSPHHLEKDVSPSVLSSGDALSFKYCYAIFSGKRCFDALSASSQIIASVNVWPFNHHWGAYRCYPKPHRPELGEMPLHLD